jgi:HD superfamily phosphodiesterase
MAASTAQARVLVRAFSFLTRARNRPLAESVAHFYEKLLTLKGLMKTAAGRREADARHNFMVAFLAQMDSEAAGV